MKNVAIGLALLLTGIAGALYWQEYEQREIPLTYQCYNVLGEPVEWQICDKLNKGIK